MLTYRTMLRSANVFSKKFPMAVLSRRAIHYDEQKIKEETEKAKKAIFKSEFTPELD